MFFSGLRTKGLEVGSPSTPMSQALVGWILKHGENLITGSIIRLT